MSARLGRRKKHAIFASLRMEGSEMTIQHYAVTKKMKKSVICPACGKPAEKMSFTIWNSDLDDKGRKVYNGVGKKFTQYDHEFDVIDGLIRCATVSCKAPLEDVVCKHDWKISSTGRCMTCKKQLEVKNVSAD